MAEYILTTEELAQRLGVSGSRIRQLVMQGRVSGIRRAGAWFFKQDAAQDYQKKKVGRPPKKQ